MSRYSAPRILGMHIHSTPATLHGIVRLAEQHVQPPDALMQSTASNDPDGAVHLHNVVQAFLHGGVDTQAYSLHSTESPKGELLIYME